MAVFARFSRPAHPRMRALFHGNDARRRRTAFPAPGTGPPRPCHWNIGMKRLAVAAIFFTLAGNTAWAEGENCRKSREYLLGSPGGDLTLPPQAYNDLFKICTAATVMPNIKDAYVLKDGGIAVVAKQDSVAATAATLARFCDDYPRAMLRFLTRKELLWPSRSPASCKFLRPHRHPARRSRVFPNSPVATGRDLSCRL